MKTRQHEKSPIGFPFLAVAVVALLVAVFPTQSRAQATCPGTTADTDGDGFTDAQECLGVLLNNPNDPAGTRVVTDPNVPDFFVILLPSNPSLLPADPFVLVSKALADHGLDWTPRIIAANQTFTGQTVGEVGNRVRAIKVTESQDLNGETQGYADVSQALAIVWTGRIKKNIVDAHAAAGIPEANIPANVFTDFYKHTTAQEVAHLLSLKTTCDARYGCHDRDGTQVVLERAVKYTTKGGKVTFYIGLNFTTADQGGATAPQ